MTEYCRSNGNFTHNIAEFIYNDTCITMTALEQLLCQARVSSAALLISNIFITEINEGPGRTSKHPTDGRKDGKHLMERATPTIGISAFLFSEMKVSCQTRTNRTFKMKFI